jgi:hypothetical protein
MRRHLKLTMALAALSVIAMSGTAFAVLSKTLTGPDGNTQSIGVSITPTKLSKSKPTPVTLDVRTHTESVTDPNRVPSPAIEAILDFDKYTKISAKGFPTCDATAIENTSTESALRACRRAKIGSGSARALIRVGSKVVEQPTTVTAFNGQPQGGHPVILLHAYGERPIQTTLVLSGPVTNYNKEGYGPRLDLHIPLIAGGTGSLIEFHATVKKLFRYKGKSVSYVTAMCKGSKKLKARGKFVFKDGESLTPTLVQKCKPKA